MREIVEDVLTWTWFSERHGYDFNGYLIRHSDGNLCIDPAELDHSTLEEIAAEGVARVLLTNRNHSRAANRVRGRTGAPTAIHRNDAAHAQGEGAEIDEDLVIGDTVGPLEVVDASGKSPGEVAFYWPERRTLIVGDTVIGNPPGACALPPDHVVDDYQRLQENVRRLLEFDVDTLLVGDGVSILTGARDCLAALVKSFDT